MPKSNLYLCYQCADDNGRPGKQFATEVGSPVVCPCGMNQADPACAKKIVQVRIVHFEAPHAIAKGVGCGRLACKPDTPIVTMNGSIMRSGDPNAVNCPMCRASDAWKEAHREWNDLGDSVEMPELPAVIVGSGGDAVLPTQGEEQAIAAAPTAS